jgi:hypothetical protein
VNCHRAKAKLQKLWQRAQHHYTAAA